MLVGSSIAIIVLGLVLLATSCQPSALEKSGQASEIMLSDPELVDYSVSVGEMRGHLRSSLAGMKIGDNTIAELHVEHPIEEGLISNIEGALQSKNQELADSLNEDFDVLADEAATGNSKKVKKAFNKLDKVLHVVVPQEKLGNSSFQVNVIKKLFQKAKDGYIFTISDSGQFIQAEADYQDAYGIYVEAKALYSGIEPILDPGSADQINNVLKVLDKAFVSVNLTQTPMPPKKVAKYFDELFKELG